MHDLQDLHFRRLVRADFPLLGGWLAQPHVRRWWNHDPAPAAVEADFGRAVDGHEPGDVFLVSDRQRPFGLLLRYTFGDAPAYIDELSALVAVSPEALSIDYFVGEPSCLRRGLGTAMIQAAVAAIWRDFPQAPAVIVPVGAGNLASWRTLEKAGFSRLAEGPLVPDNPIDDPAHHVYGITRPD